MEQNPTELEAQVIQALATLTYEQVRELTGLSRGKIYSIAMRYGARKNEAKIREKAAERKQRQKKTLAEIIDQIATADVLDYFDGLPDGDSNGGVSLIATSPPYNVGKAYGNGAGGDQMRVVSQFEFRPELDLVRLPKQLDEPGPLRPGAAH